MDIKTLCLGVLTIRDMTGYEIKKHFEEQFSHFFGAGYGSIYPALGELTQAGLVGCTDVSQDRRPDKKVYSVTESGRVTLMDALTTTAPRHKVRSEFLVLLYFADLLPPDRLAEILDERANDIESLLDHIEVCESSGRLSLAQRNVAGIGKVTLQAQLGYIREHRDALLSTVAAPRETPAATQPGIESQVGDRP